MQSHEAHGGGRFWVGLGENTDGMPNNNFGDKPESWIFGKLGLTAPTPKRDTAHEASRNPTLFAA